MDYFIVTSYYSNLIYHFIEICQGIVSANTPRFGFTIWKLHSDFQTHIFISKHFVLFPRLIL